eukprot:m.244331 g.244331  ORF g.244331 m.244331 type:complete len:129 (+) comp10953_c0_seq17:77-463(+)
MDQGSIFCEQKNNIQVPSTDCKMKCCLSILIRCMYVCAMQLQMLNSSNEAQLCRQVKRSLAASVAEGHLTQYPRDSFEMARTIGIAECFIAPLVSWKQSAMLTKKLCQGQVSILQREMQSSEIVLECM